MNIVINRWANTTQGPIYIFRLINESGAYVELTNWGATWVSAYMYGADGRLSNVLLSYSCAEEYMMDTYYMGATIGRFANRIHQGVFSIDGKVYSLEKNDGNNTNHGGFAGFNKKIWAWEQIPNGIRYILHSPNRDGGYPGNLQVIIEYIFSETNTLTIFYRGITDCNTYVNLTNHAYFNLSGNNGKIDNHKLYIPSNEILDTMADFIPTGSFRNISSSLFDFTSLRDIGTYLYDNHEQIRWNKGYNHYYILKKEKTDDLVMAATLYDPESKRMLSVATDYPGVLLYTGGYLFTPNIGICLETQYFPDTPSHSHFPSCILTPEREYRHMTIYEFYPKKTNIVK